MAPLKSLEREHPAIDFPFQQFCASHGIYSVQDFLVFDLYVLTALAEKHATSERLKEVNHNSLQKVLKNIVCHSVYDMYTLFDVLHHLKFNLSSQILAGGRVRLLIVDSISSLITPILGVTNLQGRALMVSAGSLLKKIAYEHNIAVLVTNHMVGGDGGIQKPALGESWKSIPHVRLQLFHEQGNNLFHVSLLRHPYMASGKATTFMLCE